MIRTTDSGKKNKKAKPTSDKLWILGLDLGPASVGWAAVECSSKEKPKGLLACGVRRFDAGVEGGSDKISAGRDEPRALARRQARSLRRSTWRRRRRMRSLYLILARNGMLPEADDSPEARHEAVLQLDADLRAEFLDDHSRPSQHLLPYVLRRQALDEALSPLALGRAIYQLAQRRGYKSNRKTETSDEDRGAVATGISELEQAIADSDSRTVGEFFASLDPEEIRIRNRWTARQMFIDEFNLIWDKQAELQPALCTDELRDQVFHAIFDQRPLKSQKHLIGKCELEPTRRSAPLACLPFQEFRLLQRVNDLKVISPLGEETRLTPEQRSLLIETLQAEGDITWAAVRKLLGLTTKETIGHEEKDGKKKAIKRGYRFNFEVGGDKKMIGNRTAAKLRKHIPDRWDSMSDDQRLAFVDEILSFQSEEALARRLVKGWDLQPSDAAAVSQTVLEQGYGNHSRKAIGRLLPRLREGEQYATIRRDLYPEQFEAVEPLDLLPPVLDVPGFEDVKNPTVMRTLTEVRKVVNALIRKYGKPVKVRIELARDLKHARKRREKFAEVRDQNEKARTNAAKKIVAETNDESLIRNHANILKVRLAEECGWICPYSGKPINIRQLVVSPQFEIEHIVPYSRSFDNSFTNKTLCHTKFNREKSNRTPYEAFGGRDDFPEMLNRVRRFQGGLADRKLALFQREGSLTKDEFSNRMLNDTRYISRKACEYLGVLFGGVNDAEGTQRVQALPGRCTANLRNNWDLNRILGHPAKKERADHRHHAIDAVVIAVTTPRLVKDMSKAAEAAEARNTRMLFDPIDPPWKKFHDDVHQAIDEMIVSSRVSKRTNGALHKETILSHPQGETAKGDTIHHVRKPIESLSAGDLDNIVDPVVGEIIRKAVKAAGKPPAKAFADPTQHPHMLSKSDPSRVIPIHRVRVRKSDKPMPIGKGSGKRYVNPGSNHHMEIVAVLDDDGNETKWEGHLVSRFDAATRLRNGQPVIQHDHGPGRQFKFSLTGSEHVRMNHDGEGPKIYRLNGISSGDLEFVLHSDARPITIRKKIKGARVRSSSAGLKKYECEKVVISPIGDVLPASD